MNRQTIAQTNHQQKVKASQVSGILQRTAVHSVQETSVQQTKGAEQLVLSNSRFSEDFSSVSANTTTPLQIMAKLMIGSVGDKYEQEANRVATEVISRINAPTAVLSGQAEAFTTGQNIFFRQGEDNIGSREGQQNGGRVRPKISSNNISQRAFNNETNNQTKSESKKQLDKIQTVTNQTNGKQQVQRWFLQNSATYYSKPEQFHAQQLNPITGAFTNIQTPASSPQLRVSEDGKMAIEHSDLTNRQSKVFYATDDIVTTSNQKLVGAGAKFVLMKEKEGALTVKDEAEKEVALNRIVPRERKKSEEGFWGALNSIWSGKRFGNAGLEMTVEATCVAVAEAIMGQKIDRMLPLLEKHLPSSDAFLYEYRVARYFTDYQAHGATVAEANVSQDIPTEPTAMNNIARAYSILLKNQPENAANIAEELGVNTFADPKVGQAYQTISLGIPNDSLGGLADYSSEDEQRKRTLYDDPNVASGKRREIWGNHVGAVVAESKGNKVTLENYARTHEEGALGASDPRYYFQMYGPKTKQDQTWHEQWTTSVIPLINPITMVYGK